MGLLMNAIAWKEAQAIKKIDADTSDSDFNLAMLEIENWVIDCAIAQIHHRILNDDEYFKILDGNHLDGNQFVSVKISGTEIIPFILVEIPGNPEYVVTIPVLQWNDRVLAFRRR